MTIAMLLVNTVESADRAAAASAAFRDVVTADARLKRVLASARIGPSLSLPGDRMHSCARSHPDRRFARRPDARPRRCSRCPARPSSRSSAPTARSPTPTASRAPAKARSCRSAARPSSRSPAAAEPELPFELRQADDASIRSRSTSPPTACEPCNSGRQMLKQRGIPFNEKLVVTAEDSEALERLSGAREAPTLSRRLADRCAATPPRSGPPTSMPPAIRASRACRRPTSTAPPRRWSIGARRRRRGPSRAPKRAACRRRRPPAPAARRHPLLSGATGRR